MKKSGSKVLTIVLIVIVLLVIAGGALAFTYFYTDTFKSSQELFAKYLTQNLEELSQTINLNKIDELEDKLEQNKYEQSMTISYIEEGKTAPNGIVKIDTQNDPLSKKIYSNISLETQNPEETLKIEYMKENNKYSLRFTNAVLQFITIENSNLKQLAANLGLNEDVIEKIPNTIDFENYSLDKLNFSEEEKNTEINRYLGVLYNNITKEKYSKNKNTVITVNGKTITTNAYILTLNAQDLKNLSIKLLEALKQDEILLNKLEVIDNMIQEYSNESLKDKFVETLQNEIDKLTKEEIVETENVILTIYAENRNTVRIKIEQGLQYITIDSTETEEKKQIDDNYTRAKKTLNLVLLDSKEGNTNIDEDNTQSTKKVTFIKENNNKLIIQFNTVNGEEQHSKEANIELIENGSNIKIDITIDDEEGQTALSRNINFVDEISYEVTLDASNNIILNQISSEQISTIFTILEDKLNTEYIEKIKPEHLEPFKIVIEPITTILMYNIAKESIDTTINSLNEAEKEAFNAIFKTYEGTDVLGTEVNQLLNVVLTNNLEEANNATEHYIIVTGDVTLNQEDISITEVEEQNYYEVECKTDENGFINEIVILQKDTTSNQEIDDNNVAPTDQINNMAGNIISGLYSLN